VAGESGAGAPGGEYLQRLMECACAMLFMEALESSPSAKESGMG